MAGNPVREFKLEPVPLLSGVIAEKDVSGEIRNVVKLPVRLYA